MQYFYELAKSQAGFPFKAFIHSVDRLKMRWHNELEIILVLQGSIQVRIGNEPYLLHENDLLLINSNEIHSLSRTSQDNILLVLQINPDYYSFYHSKFNKMIFNCKSFLFQGEEQEKFDLIRHYLAKIIWELDKKKTGYQFIVGSEIHLLAACLVKHFEYSLLEDDQAMNVNKDIGRIQSILKYIEENSGRQVSLKEIADHHQINQYYLSHFIKKKMGMSFQEYLNSIRLDKAINLLLSSNKPITEISYASGFPSIKSFNRRFKNMYGCSPTEYKKANTPKFHDRHQLGEAGIDKSKRCLAVDRRTLFKSLFTYLTPPDAGIPNASGLTARPASLSLNAQRKGRPYQPYWKKLITYTKASEGLRKGWQDQLTELQREIGFEYIRFHGIFSDDMMVCNVEEGGKGTYNWSYVDELFDFFQEVKIKPFIELGTKSQPRDMQSWLDLVTAFLKHCINRYGLKEVETWYFEVWNESEAGAAFWLGGKEPYFSFYKHTMLAVKAVADRCKVGGPAISYQNPVPGSWLADFLAYCSQNSLALDFLALHIHPEWYTSFDKNLTYDTLNSIHKKIKELLDYQPEVHITEWNASAFSRSLIHDTCFVSTHIISNVVKCLGETHSLGYWTFSDINEDYQAGGSAFHGGFGLINQQGLKKPSYFAYYLLAKLGEEVMQQGDEYIVTKKDEAVQILVYNYAYFDELFLQGDTSALTHQERYPVFEAKPAKEIALTISGLSGHYKITRYSLNREHGSVFDAWVRMGAPKQMTQEELSYLKRKVHPQVSVAHLELTGDYQAKLAVPVHGVELITVEKLVI